LTLTVLAAGTGIRYWLGRKRHDHAPYCGRVGDAYRGEATPRNFFQKFFALIYQFQKAAFEFAFRVCDIVQFRCSLLIRFIGEAAQRTLLYHIRKVGVVLNVGKNNGNNLKLRCRILHGYFQQSHKSYGNSGIRFFNASQI
jgi:hypothetical protein